MVFRQMLRGIGARAAVQELRSEGLLYLYRGALPPFCQKTINMSLMFGVFEMVRKGLVGRDVHPDSAILMSAAVSGTVESLGMPFERVQTLLADGKYNKRFKNTYHAFKDLRSYGVKEYYRGYVTVITKNAPSNMTFFALKDVLPQYMSEPRNKFHKTANEFLSGGLIGVINSMLFYPINVSRVAMQSKLGGPHEHFVRVLIELYKIRGRRIRNIYHGIAGNCCRSFMSWGVINAGYEQCKIILSV